jgi:hypothetical protein
MSMRARSKTLALAIAPWAVLTACSSGPVVIGVAAQDTGPHDSSTSDAGHDGTGDSTSPDRVSAPDGGGGPQDSSLEAGFACPTDPPDAGSSCSDVGLVCEYGSNVAIACDEIATCTKSKVWSYTLPSGTTAPCTDAGAADCPSEYPLASVGDSCAPNGLVCSYPQGTCTCSPGAPEAFDASPASHWKCFPVQTGCPTNRPRLGQSCTTKPGITCNYGACADGVEVHCVDGIWEEVAESCSPPSSPDS